MSRVVVSDTSPIRALANLGRLDLLQALFATVVIPPAVERELANPPAGHAIVAEPGRPFLRVQPVSNEELVARFRERVHSGESEALALALELGAGLILMDEKDGRALARQAGLTPIGVLGVLLEAKQRGLVTAVAPLLDQIRTTYQFFIAPGVRSAVLNAANETP